MEDYKEPISRVQKRRQLKRLLAIMGVLVVAIVIFFLGVRIGIQVEKERMRISKAVSSKMEISKEAEPPHVTSKEMQTPDVGKGAEAPSVPEKKEEEMRLTFYETLTKKETSAKREEPRQKSGVEPPVSRDVKEARKAVVPKTLYFVQVGSFRNRERAEALREDLLKKGYKVDVTSVEIEDKGHWYRVRLGGYRSLKEAQGVRRKVLVEEKIQGARVVSKQ